MRMIHTGAEKKGKLARFSEGTELKIAAQEYYTTMLVALFDDFFSSSLSPPVP